MNILRYLLSVISNTFSPSSSPNLFGSRKRRKEKDKLSEKIEGFAEGIDDDISEAQSKNPFESAGAKLAMTKASQNASQMHNRLLNTMGANASPEAMLAAQGSLNQATGSAAGQIAAGSEANKAQEIARLRGLQAGFRQQSAGVKQSSIDERGSGWKDFFTAVEQIGTAVGNATGGVGKGLK